MTADIVRYCCAPFLAVSLASLILLAWLLHHAPLNPPWGE